MSKVIPFKGKKGGKGGGGKRPPEPPKTQTIKSGKNTAEKTADQLFIESMVRGRGRPKSINLKDPVVVNQILMFGRLGSTQHEMADWFMVNRTTIQDYMRDTDGIFHQTYTKGLSEGKSTLRRLQWANAQKGNYKMQIWLGKQLLGQKERVQHSGDEESPVLVKISDDVPEEA